MKVNVRAGENDEGGSVASPGDACESFCFDFTGCQADQAITRSQVIPDTQIKNKLPDSWVMKILIDRKSKLRDLTGEVDRDEQQYIGGGTFGDVYRGVWMKESLGERKHSEVVVKVLRSTGHVDPKTLAKTLKVREQFASIS